MICRANQWTGFYMITTSDMKELIIFNQCYSITLEYIFDIWINDPRDGARNSKLFQLRNYFGKCCGKMETEWSYSLKRGNLKSVFFCYLCKCYGMNGVWHSVNSLSVSVADWNLSYHQYSESVSNKNLALHWHKIVVLVQH